MVRMKADLVSERPTRIDFLLYGNAVFSHQHDLYSLYPTPDRRIQSDILQQFPIGIDGGLKRVDLAALGNNQLRQWQGMRSNVGANVQDNLATLPAQQLCIKTQSSRLESTKQKD